HGAAQVPLGDVDVVRVQQAVRLTPEVADLTGDPVRLIAEGEGFVVVAREPQEGTRAREVLAQHREVAQLLPQRPRLLETRPRGSEIADGRVRSPQVVQREGDLLSSVQLACDREGTLARVDRLDRIAAAEDVQD